MQVVLGIEDRDLRLALELYLDEEPGLYLVGTAVEAACVLVLAEAACPDLLIVSWDLPGDSPVNLLAAVKRLVHPPQVIVLSNDEGAGQDALAAGADGFISKNFPPDGLLLLLRRMQLLDT